MVTIMECKKHEFRKIYYRKQAKKGRSWISVKDKVICIKCLKIFNLVTTERSKKR